MKEAHLPLRLLVDEDLSPTVAQRLREVDGIDAVAVRDRGLLGATDRKVLDLAFDEDRILVTANVADFWRLASARELHPGIILIEQGDLGRDEQLATVRSAIARIIAEAQTGGSMINRALVVTDASTMRFEDIPSLEEGY